MTTEKILAWHFLSNDGQMQFGKREQVETGKTYTISTKERPLSLCHWGLHASKRAIDALSYAPGSMACRVELGGEILRDTDKFCATQRHVLWMADATRTLHEFSAWAAEWILDRLEATSDFKADPRSRATIAAKRRWLVGEITDKELAAAWVAARDAAGAAAGAAARDAAWVAARAAARDAAWVAAGAAARDAAGAAAWVAARAAARDAAWVAAWDELNAKLTEMLLALEPAEVAS